MATTTSSSIIGTTSQSKSLDASEIEEAIVPTAENALLSDDAEQLLKAPASSIKQSQTAALSTAIKAFVEKISELIATLSKLLESLSLPTALAAEKKANSLPSKTTTSKTGAKKTTTKKDPEKSKGKLANEAKKIASLASQTSASDSGSSSSIATKASSELANNSPLISNPDSIFNSDSAKNSSITIDPIKGHGDENLAVSTNRLGAPQIYTEDGFIISFEAKEQAWNITSPQGRVSRIWGDPHVAESDGDRWDFKDRSSFLFGNNKVTIETVPLANGQTLSSKVTIYNGDSRVTVSGIDKDAPVFEAIRRDAKIDDALQDDGDIFILGTEANGEDQFILLKDSGEKFSQQVSLQLSNAEFKDKHLTSQQIAALN